MLVEVYIREIKFDSFNISIAIRITLLQTFSFDNLLLNKTFFDLPSTRNQKAKEKRSRHSAVMSDIKNLGVMLRNYTNSEIRDQEVVDQIKIDPESRRRQRNLGQNEGNYRSLS